MTLANRNPDAIDLDLHVQRGRGFALMAAGGLVFASMGALAKLASPSVPTFELVAARSAVAWVVVEIVRRQARVPLVFHDRGALLLRSLAGFIAVASYFYALRYIPLGDAVLLNNASPVLTSIGAVWLLGERMTVAKVVAMLASMVGVWLLVQHRTGAMESRGALVGAFSALVSAVALVSLKVATRRNRSIIVVWSLSGLSTLFSLTLLDRDWLWPDGREGLLLLGTGIAASVAQLLMTAGYRLLDASEASVYSYLTPVFAVVLSAVVFRDLPTPSSVAGGALIVASGAGVAWFSRQNYRGAV